MVDRMQTNRRDLLRTTAGIVAAGIVGGAMLHGQAGEAQAVERDLQQTGGQGDMFDVKIEGSHQGAFFRVTGLGFHYQVGVPLSAHGTHSSGARQHGRVVVTKFWDAATPQLFQALVSGEILSRVELSFMRDGTIYQRMILLNARVANLEQYMHFNATGHTIGDDPRQLEDVSFAFSEITIENLEGKSQASDIIA